MRAAIFISAFVFLNVTHAQWFAQNSGTVNELKSVYFVNNNTGFICSYYSVLKTTNGGTNWDISPVAGRHNSLTFINNTTGFVCSDSGKIHRTTNAGNSWVLLSTNTDKSLTSISFWDEQTGLACGHSNTLLKTTDGGANWFSLFTTVEQIDFLSVKLTGSEKYFVSGTGSSIIRTTDGGTNWILFTLNEVNPLFTMEFLNSSTGFATGCCGMFLTTTNAGNNWTMNYYLSLGYTFKTLEFINSTTGYISGDNGMIFRTTNAGAWWDSTVTGTDQNFYSMFMTDANTGWAVGNYGTILKTTNGGGPGYTIGLNLLSNEVPSEYKLYQNYPNPFNPTTHFGFRIAEFGLVKITIFSVIGEEIETVLDKKLPPGTYEIDFDGSNLPSGVYFYQLKTPDFSAVKKMVLLK